MRLPLCAAVTLLAACTATPPEPAVRQVEPPAPAPAPERPWVVVPTHRPHPAASERWAVASELPGLAGWKVVAGKQNAAATAAASKDGGLSWEISFTGRDGLEYAELAIDRPLPAGVGAMAWGLAWQADHPWVPALRVRLIDASGEVHQFTAGRPRFDDRRNVLVVFDGEDAVWGGDGNKRLDQPVRLQSLIVDRPGRGLSAHVTATLTAPVLLSRRPPAAEPAFTLEARQPPVGQIYDTGTPGELRARLPRGSVTWRIEDLAGRGLAQGSGGDPEVLVPLPTTVDGWYDVTFTVRDGAARAVHTYRCLARPAGRVRNPSLGVCTHFQWVGRKGSGWTVDGLAVVDRLGFGAIRDEIPWGAAEPDLGTYRLTRHPDRVPAQADWFIDPAVQLGLEPLLIFCYGHAQHPAWPTTAAARTAFAGYAARQAAAYPSVKSFEVWNEWSVGTGVPKEQRDGRNTAEAYAELLKEVVPAVRAVRPDAQLIGTGGEHPRWQGKEWEAMLKAGSAAATPLHSLHPYRWQGTPEASGLVAEIEQASALVRSHGGSGRLWITEIGWTCPPENMGVDERGQAQCTLRALALLRSIPAVERVFLYDLMDDGLDPSEKEHHFGLVHHSSRALMPKPAAAVVAVFNRLTAGRPCGERTVRGDLHAVRWADAGGDDLLLVWSAGAPQPFQIEGAARASDAAGRPLAAVPATVDGWPVYLRGPGVRLR
jgi:hypothetical protein